MLDQNTTTIITTAIAVLSAWGAVIFAGIINNSRESKKEKRQLEQEKLKSDKAIIEEVYQTLGNVHHLCVSLAYDVRDPKNNDVDTAGRIKEISSTTQRVVMLVRLHLDVLTEEVKAYEDNITAYWNRMGGFYASRGSLNSPSGVFIQEGLLKAEVAYQQRLANLQTKLEKVFQAMVGKK